MIRTMVDGCPYGPDDCPKLQAASEALSDIQRRLLTVERLLYTAIGIIMLETGVMIV